MQNTPAELCERVFYCAIISRLFDDLHRAVVIAMVAVLMMQTTVYQVIHMVAMLDGGVSAVCAVGVGVVCVCLTIGHFCMLLYRVVENLLQTHCKRLVKLNQ